MKKSICVQLSDEVKKSYAWLAEIKQQNNSESLVEEALEYILSLDSELEKDGEKGRTLSDYEGGYPNARRGRKEGKKIRSSQKRIRQNGRIRFC